MKLPQRFRDAEQPLHDAASTATGLDDFGRDDYREGLRVLLESYDREASLSEAGRANTYGLLQSCLQGRLLARHGLRQRPDCREQPIERPVFIVGLPRTGTTVLHRLLAEDPANQGLEYWLGCAPMPRPPRAAWPAQPAFQRVDGELSALMAANPGLKAIHAMSADTVDECRLLLMQSFANVTFQSNAGVPSYAYWLAQTDLAPAYRHYADCLRLIGADAPGRRWILKDPSHLWAMGTLLQTFPDALIVQTHREPSQLIASVSSLVLNARRGNEPGVSPVQVGREQLDQWAKMLTRSMAVRERFPDHFHDIYFSDFLADPLAVVKAIYARLGTALSAAGEAAMRRWIAANPQHQHGGHRYAAADFGLDQAAIRARFADYSRRFGL